MFRKFAFRLATAIIIGLIAFGLSSNVAKAMASTQIILAQASTDASQIDVAADAATGEGLAPWAIRLIGIGGFAVLFVIGWIVARASHNKQHKSRKLKVTLLRQGYAGQASSKKKISKSSITKSKTKKTVKKTSRRPK